MIVVHNAESGACGRGFERMEIFKLKYTNTKIQIHKYECRIANKKLQIHKYDTIQCRERGEGACGREFGENGNIQIEIRLKHNTMG